MPYSEWERRQERRRRRSAMIRMTLSALVVAVLGWLAITFVIVLWGRG